MNRFDRFSDWVAEQAARPAAFAIALSLVLAWLCAGPFLGWSNDLYHLILNSPTTAITFLLVALSYNDSHRFERAVNQRLQEIIDKLDGAEDPVRDEGQKA